MWGYVPPALPCRFQCPLHSTVRVQVTLYLFASPLALPQIQYGAHRPKPSARQTRKTPRRLYQPRGPPTHLIPADSPFALKFPRHSCDIHGLAALHPHGSNLTNTRCPRPSNTAATHRLPALAPSGQTHSPAIDTLQSGISRGVRPLSTCEDDQGIS